MITTTITPVLRSFPATADPTAMLARLVATTRGFVYRRRHDPAWTMEFVSDGCRDVTGYDPHRFIANESLSFADLIHPADRDRVERGVAGAIEHRRRRTLRYRIRTAYGALVSVEDRLLPVFDARGAVTAIEGIIDLATDDPLMVGADSGWADAFADAFRRNPVPLVLSRGDGTVGAINAACVRRFNLSVEEILGDCRLDDLLRSFAERLGRSSSSLHGDLATALGAVSVAFPTPLGADTVLTALPRNEPVTSTLWWRASRARSPRRRARRTWPAKRRTDPTEHDLTRDRLPPEHRAAGRTRTRHVLSF
jgi:PAS domain-containing protein